MIVVDEKLLDSFRRKPTCEWCGRPRPRGVVLDPHHVFSRGMGGGSRLDVAINVIGLCRECHSNAHSGVILQVDLLALVAQRENTTQDAIRAEIYRLRRTPRP